MHILFPPQWQGCPWWWRLFQTRFLEGHPVGRTCPDTRQSCRWKAGRELGSRAMEKLAEDWFLTLCRIWGSLVVDLSPSESRMALQPQLTRGLKPGQNPVEDSSNLVQALVPQELGIKVQNLGCISVTWELSYWSNMNRKHFNQCCYILQKANWSLENFSFSNYIIYVLKVILN